MNDTSVLIWFLVFDVTYCLLAERLRMLRLRLIVRAEAARSRSILPEVGDLVYLKGDR